MDSHDLGRGFGAVAIFKWNGGMLEVWNTGENKAQ